MKKSLKPLLLITILSLTACSNKSSESVSPSTIDSFESTTSEIEESESLSEETSELTNKDIFKMRNENSHLADSHFKNGFYLISPESTNQYYETTLDYNGERETDFYTESQYNTYWQMCQWWTPFNFKDATYKKVGNIHTYQNESRFFGIDTENGTLQMKLNSYTEYQELYSGRRPGNASWSHFLIQESIPADIALKCSDYNVNNDDEVKIKFDFRIDECTFLGDKDNMTGSDCAQLMFYILLYNYPPEGSNPEEVGKKGQRMWFGLPLYDSRYQTIPAYASKDAGFDGATNLLIYNIANKLYLPQDGLEFHKTYSIDFNILEYIREAFMYGSTNGFLPNCKWQNMYISYMNFGWELPGEFSVDSTLSNLDIYGIKNS